MEYLSDFLTVESPLEGPPLVFLGGPKKPNQLPTQQAEEWGIYASLWYFVLAGGHKYSCIMSAIIHL